MNEYYKNWIIMLGLLSKGCGSYVLEASAKAFWVGPNIDNIKNTVEKIVVD